MARLLAARRPVSAPAQLIHGDLAGNVLFADGLPPAVIDFSPYWRPKGYASSIIVTDAVVWHSADLALLTSAMDSRDDVQLLVRALLFRLLAERDPAKQASAYRPAIDYADALLRA